MWEKNKDFKSITDVVQYHTGMLSEEFLNPPKDPHIKNLRDAVILTQTFLKKGFMLQSLQIMMLMAFLLPLIFMKD